MHNARQGTSTRSAQDAQARSTGLGRFSLRWKVTKEWPKLLVTDVFNILLSTQ